MELVHDTASAPPLEKRQSGRLFALAFTASLGLHLAAGAAFLYRAPSPGVAEGAPETISVSLVPSTVFEAAEERVQPQQEAAASSPVEGAENGKPQGTTKAAEKPQEEPPGKTPPPPDTTPEAAKPEAQPSPLPPVLTARDESPDAVPKPVKTHAEKPGTEPQAQQAPRARDTRAENKPRRAKQPPPRQRRAAASGRGASAASGHVSASRGSLNDYIAAIRARLARHKPAGLPYTGTVKVAFAISAGGHLIYARLAQSSGRAALDTAALRAVRAAAPFPPPPGGRTFTTVIPFDAR
jgi:protein TonB